MNITEITSAKKKTNEPNRLAAYCRVSSDSADQLHSFAAQIRYYTDYVNRHPEYTLVDIYADEGLTGTSMKNRDELNRLIRDCQKGKIDRVITKSVSRFARNTQDLLTVLRLFKEINVSVLFEEQGIDTDKLNMEMIVTFPGMAAQQESESISGNMRWSYKKRMESGEFNCCAPAYGFNMVDGQLVVNEDEAIVVRRIFNMYLQGMGKQAIANVLNGENIPRRYGQKRWYCFTIDYMLNNERYIGNAMLQKQYTTEVVPFRRIRNHGEITRYYIENSNPPIVSKEMYDNVQNLQQKRKINALRQKHIYPLSKILRCPDCNRTFRRIVTSGKVYWTCSGEASGSTKCKKRRVQEDMVYDTFVTLIYKLKDNRESIIRTLIRQIELMQNRYNGQDDEIHQIDREIANLGSQNLVLARLHGNGILNAAEYTAQSSEINSKITELRLKRKRRLSEDDTDEILDTLKSLDEILEEYEPNAEFDEELFGQIVEKITVIDNSKLRFNLIGGLALTEAIQEIGRCKTA